MAIAAFRTRCPCRAHWMVLLASLLSMPVFAADEFGPVRDNPVTADPPVTRPDTAHCSVQIVDHGFDNFDTYVSSIAPPADCPGPWSKVVLEMDGSVAGVQFDRIGHIEIGGITVFRTSTAEPSRDGVSWHVEKDISAYSALLKSQQPVGMFLGNVVDGTYTGVIHVKARVVFYQADARNPVASAPDAVEPLLGLRRDGADVVGDYVMPVDTARWVGEVYATGSGGGCEEFWYFIAPASTNYSCPGFGPYREVQVLVDGRVAGIAMPYPHIYTGGWSNPFLWYVIPAPRAFDIKPIRYDLTPFIGLVNDGRPHEVRFRIVGLEPDASGWELQPNMQVWRDPRGVRTRGGLLKYRLGELENVPVVTALAEGATQVATRGGHKLEVTGWLQTSRGYTVSTLVRTVGNTNTHVWDDGENHDAVKGDWNDTATLTTTAPKRVREVQTDSQSFGFDGSIAFEAVPGQTYFRITTLMSIYDKGNAMATSLSAAPTWLIRDDRFSGNAGWNYGVPREERHAIGQSTQQYTQRTDSRPCYKREISQSNGFVTRDRTLCR